MIQLVPATRAHVGRIANRMRACDVEEIAAFGHSPKGALRLGLRCSLHVYTALLDGKPEAMLGLTPLNALEREGSPWMLGSEKIYNHPRAMLHLGPIMLARFRDSSRNLSGLVAKSNARAIRMLRRWGFQLDEQPIEHGGVVFVRFAMED